MNMLLTLPILLALFAILRPGREMINIFLKIFAGELQSGFSRFFWNVISTNLLNEHDPLTINQLKGESCVKSAEMKKTTGPSHGVTSLIIRCRSLFDLTEGQPLT